MPSPPSILPLLLLLSSLLSLIIHPHHKQLAITLETLKLNLPLSKATLVAEGSYELLHKQNGWGNINIKTYAGVSDVLQAYGLGYVEGNLSYETISQIRLQVKSLHPHLDQKKFLVLHDQEIRQKLKSLNFYSNIDLNNPHPNFMSNPIVSTEEDKFWFQAALNLAQLDGLIAGYNAVVSTGGLSPEYGDTSPLTLLDAWYLQTDADMPGLEFGWGADYTSRGPLNVITEETSIIMVKHNRCSAILKLTFDDLLIGHATFANYIEMLKSMKHIETHYKSSAEFYGGKTVQRSSYSSYPGFLSSTDDWYSLSSGLFITETTLELVDSTLAKIVSPANCVLGWMSTNIANRIATTPQQWADVYSFHNSFTMSSQWMIVDLNAINAAKLPSLQLVLPLNSVLIFEIIPGLTHTEDISRLLNDKKYFASYNIAWNPQIRDKLGFTARATQPNFGFLFDYNNSPRALIFAREQYKVVDVESMKALLRHNDYINDPLSQGCPHWAIAGRNDLQPLAKCPQKNVMFYGSQDAKVTSVTLALEYKYAVVCGPPANEHLPPFSWEKSHFGQKLPPHFGQPDEFNFSWMLSKPAIF